MKKFRLPKEFAEKWLEALRSKKYKQTNGTLCHINRKGNPSYCCLGVAGSICDVDNDNMEMKLVLEHDYSGLVPTEIVGASQKNELVKLCALLNDGMSVAEFEAFKYKGINFREEVRIKNNLVTLNFKMIADVIEDNCELY